eukprot:gene9751-11976_t
MSESNDQEQFDRLEKVITNEIDYFKSLTKPWSENIEKIKSSLLSSGVKFPKDKLEQINGYEYDQDRKTLVLFRRRISDGFIQNLLDEKEDGFSFHDITSFKVSNDNRHFFVIRDNGDETYRIVVKSIADNESRSKYIMEIDGVINAEWGSNQNLYFTVPDEMKRPYRVYRRAITERDEELDEEDEEYQDIDQLIFDEKEQENLIDVVKSKDKKFLFICSNNKTTSVFYYINLEKDDAPSIKRRPKPKLSIKKQEGLEYYIEHNDNQFIVFANIDKKDLSVYSMPDTTENGSFDDMDLEPLVKSVENQFIQDVDVFKDKLVLCELYNSSPRIRIISKDPNTKKFSESFEKIINFPQVSKVHFGVNDQYENQNGTIRLFCQTPLTPSTSYDININTHQIIKLDEPVSYGNLSINTSEFEMKKVFIPSKHDPSIKIPMSLIYDKSINLNGNNPTLIIGYGSYGATLEPEFNNSDRYLLKNGWVIALAHVRGGGDLGRNWYYSGRGFNKQNTFNDFIDCVEYLFAEGYSNPRKLIAKGTSAGGLLVGHVALKYPQYFSGIIARVPFLDVLSTMLDKTLPLTVLEYGEWGNPSQDQTVFDYIKTYDPYQLIEQSIPNGNIRNLPSMLITCSQNDFRTPFWQPLKWVSKLRYYLSQHSQKQQNQSMILLDINEEDGHFGPKDKHDVAYNRALEFEFMNKCIE